jgi:hypothetical protein
VTFSDKYEILETITGGRVESFIARKIANGERVLACIFDCPEQKPHQPTVQWILESFHAIAPKPPGLVIDTGQYAGTSYGYLITKLPADDLLREWVKSYEADQSGIAVEPAVPSSPADEINKVEEVPASDQDTLCGSGEAHGITEAFEALRLGLTPGRDVKQVPLGASDPTGVGAAAGSGFHRADATDSPDAEKEEPGEFTGKFPPPWGANQQRPTRRFPESFDCDDPVRASTSEISGSNTGGCEEPLADPSSASSVFQSRVPSTVQPWEGTRPIAAPGLSALPSANANADDDNLEHSKAASTGEFTSFFRGPFNGEHAQRTPDLVPSPAPPAKKAGEFTELFGPEKDIRSVGVPSSSPKPAASPVSGDAESITGLLAQFDKPAKGPKSDMGAKPLPPNPWSPNVVVRRHSTEKDVGDFELFKQQTQSDSDLFSPAASPRNTPASEGRGNETDFSSGSDPAGATRVFTTPGSGTAPGRSHLPEGPSEYTRFISGGTKSPVSGKEPFAAGGPEDPSAPRASHAVPMPAVPPAPSPYGAVPHTPQFPQAGGHPHIAASPQPAHIVEGGCYQVPTPPGIAPPRAPQLPQIGAATPKAAAIPWALILTLNGLFLLAVLLVVYFALKH